MADEKKRVEDGRRELVMAEQDVTDRIAAMEAVLRRLFWRHPPLPPLTPDEYDAIREVVPSLQPAERDDV